MPHGIYILAPSWFPLVYGPDERAWLDREITWSGTPQSAASIRQNLGLLQDVEVVFAGWGTTVMDAEFLAAAPRLKAVFHAGGSIRYFTTPAFWDRGIILSTATATNALPVAEYTVAALLFGLRGGWHYERRAHADGAFPPAIQAPGSYRTVVGLVSLGAVGRLVVERLKAYDMTIIAHDPYLAPAEARALGVELVSLNEVFGRSHAVSLHAPLLDATRGMIRGVHFDAMKPGALFINTARGAVVNEPEMTEVLTRRPDLQAVLDVTDPEPPVPSSPLFRLPNVVLTPHIAQTTGRELERLGAAMVDEYRRWREGTPLRHTLTRETSLLRG